MMERFAKRIMSECSCATRSFSREGWMNCGIKAFDKDFVKNTAKRVPTGKHFGVFSPRYSRNYILSGNSNSKVGIIRDFLSKIRTLFSFSKRARKASPLLLVAPLWVWLNKHQYLWICVNILRNTWINCSDYARALNMHDHLTCSTGIWRYLGF